MIQELANLTSKLSNIRDVLKHFGLDINLTEGRTSLNKIKEGLIKIDWLIKNKRDLKNCLLGLCGSLQKLEGLGIDLNKSDLWFVSPYKKELKADYEYRALLRVASENGFLALATLIPIKIGEKFATYYKDNLVQIDYRDEGLPKHITLDTIKDYRFFFCLLTLKDKKTLNIIHQVKIQLTPEELLVFKNKTKFEDVYDIKKYNYTTQKKEVVGQGKSVWNEFTRQMVNKTLIKQAFSLLREVLPWTQRFFEFEEKEDEYNIGKSDKTKNMKDEEPKWVIKNADLDNPTDELKIEISQLIEEYKSSPIMKEQNKAKILNGLKLCKELKDYQGFVNTFIIQILSLEDKELMKTIKDKEIEISSKKIAQFEKEKKEKTEKVKIEEKPKVNPLPKGIQKGVPEGLNKDKLEEKRYIIFKKLKSDLESCETLEQLDQCFKNHIFQADIAKLDETRYDLIINTNNELKIKFKEIK